MVAIITVVRSLLHLTEMLSRWRTKVKVKRKADNGGFERC